MSSQADFIVYQPDFAAAMGTLGFEVRVFGNREDDGPTKFHFGLSVQSLERKEWLAENLHKEYYGGNLHPEHPLMDAVRGIKARETLKCLVKQGSKVRIQKESQADRCRLVLASEFQNGAQTLLKTTDLHVVGAAGICGHAINRVEGNDKVSVFLDNRSIFGHELSPLLDRFRRGELAKLDANHPFLCAYLGWNNYEKLLIEMERGVRRIILKGSGGKHAYVREDTSARGLEQVARFFGVA